MEKVTRVVAVKRYFERADAFAPTGGRKIEGKEFIALTPDERQEIASLCATELDVELVNS